MDSSATKDKEIEAGEEIEEAVVEEGAVGEEDVFCTVKTGEVPPVPENKFLYRKVETEKAATQETGVSSQQRKIGEERHRKDDYK